MDNGIKNTTEIHKKPHIYIAKKGYYLTSTTETFTIEESGTLCVTFLSQGSGSITLKINGTVKSKTTNSQSGDRTGCDYRYEVDIGDIVSITINPTFWGFRCLAFVAPSYGIAAYGWSFGNHNDASITNSYSLPVCNNYVIGVMFLYAYNGTVAITSGAQSETILKTDYGNEVVLFDSLKNTNTIAAKATSTKAICSLCIFYVV